MITLIVLFIATLFLSYSNGSNDNFKGVATLYGSNVASYKLAITVATIATLLGCLCSLFLASGLAQAFSGKGLVSEAVANSPNFLLSVSIAAGITVILATILGFPVSTTHGLTGALVGAGFIAVGTSLNLKVLGTAFFLPLIFSPIISIALTIPIYKTAHMFANRLGIDRTMCVCVGPAKYVPLSSIAKSDASVSGGLNISAGAIDDCFYKYDGEMLGVSVQKSIDAVHYLSAIALSFARGLNDTPKIAGLLLVVHWLDIRLGVLVVAAAMAIGGLLNARKVAETMSKKISKMNDGQALTANLITAALVIFASKLGLPVSTTHVSVGAITGIGMVNGSANASVIRSILLSWILTLPVAAALGGLSYWTLTRLH